MQATQLKHEGEVVLVERCMSEIGLCYHGPCSYSVGELFPSVMCMMCLLMLGMELELKLT